MVKLTSHDGLACAHCHTFVDLRVPVARGGHHIRTHVDSATGAEVRLAWCAACVETDPLLHALVENDNAPDSDAGAAEVMWAIHEQIHKRVCDREGDLMRATMSLASARLPVLSALAMAVGADANDLGDDAVRSVQASALREVFRVKRDCRLPTHTFRGPGRAWGIRAKVVKP